MRHITFTSCPISSADFLVFIWSCCSHVSYLLCVFHFLKKNKGHMLMKCCGDSPASSFLQFQKGTRGFETLLLPDSHLWSSGGDWGETAAPARACLSWCRRRSIPQRREKHLMIDECGKCSETLWMRCIPQVKWPLRMNRNNMVSNRTSYFKSIQVHCA